MACESVWWQGEFPDPIDETLWAWVDRLIYDSQQWTDPRKQYRLLKKRELAKRLGISDRTLDDWQRQGRICHLKIGRSCRYRWSDVIAKLQDTCRVN
jgi:excisionase family DNA binding protein